MYLKNADQSKNCGLCICWLVRRKLNDSWGYACCFLGKRNLDNHAHYLVVAWVTKVQLGYVVIWCIFCKLLLIIFWYRNKSCATDFNSKRCGLDMSVTESRGHIVNECQGHTITEFTTYHMCVIVCQSHLIYGPAATQFCSYKLVYVYMQYCSKMLPRTGYVPDKRSQFRPILVS